MYFDVIAKIVSERTGCDISDVKPNTAVCPTMSLKRLRQVLYGLP